MLTKKISYILNPLLYIFAVLLLLSSVLLPLMNPTVAFAAKPDTPTNVAPIDNAENTPLTPTLRASAFNDGDGDNHEGSQWQIATDAAFTNIIYDSGFDITNLEQKEIADGILQPDQTYHWRVRYYDDRYEDSLWSTEFEFDTVSLSVPNTPTNISPADASTNVHLTPDLQASPFASANGAASHASSQWQIATDAAFNDMVYDSGVSDELITLSIPEATLDFSTLYYWRVKYKDDYDQWSASWSTPTSFTTIASVVPSTPTNLVPLDGATDISLTPTLNGSVSIDEDAHAASQWQITTTSGDYASPVYDSSLDTDNLVTIEIAGGILSNGSTYYWRVRYQDSYNNWSAYSTETSFTTIPWHAPDKPSNISPGHNAIDVILTTTLGASNFHDADAGDSHLASRWQIRTDAGTYDTPVFDSGVDSENLTSLELGEGTLTYDEVYHWRVRYQDSTSQWSAWSNETLFNTITTNAPDQPSNVSPANAATDIAVRPLLTCSAFADADFVDTHMATQWQVTDTSGDYSDPVFNIAEDAENKTSLLLPILLDYGDTYYWRARYKDSYDNWSAFSAETSFTVIVSVPPATPSIDLPADEATDISLTPTLQSSDFSDADSGDTHTASQWQITTTSGDYASPVYDSGYDTTNKTTIVIPEGELTENTTYYCQVRYQDSFGNWSVYSTETSFTTIAITADFTANNTTVEAGQSLMITDNSTGGITSWNWNLGDGTTMEWTTETKPAGGSFAHQYTAAGTYTVSLQVSGPGGDDMVAKAGYITVGQAAATGGGFPTTWVIVGVVITLALGFGGFYFYRRQAG